MTECGNKDLNGNHSGAVVVAAAISGGATWYFSNYCKSRESLVSQRHYLSPKTN